MCAPRSFCLRVNTHAQSWQVTFNFWWAIHISISIKLENCTVHIGFNTLKIKLLKSFKDCFENKNTDNLSVQKPQPIASFCRCGTWLMLHPRPLLNGRCFLSPGNAGLPLLPSGFALLCLLHPCLFLKIIFIFYT